MVRCCPQIAHVRARFRACVVVQGKDDEQGLTWSLSGFRRSFSECFEDFFERVHQFDEVISKLCFESVLLSSFKNTAQNQLSSTSAMQQAQNCFNILAYAGVCMCPVATIPW
eukprot:2528459-Amphidinium_carterae.1